MTTGTEALQSILDEIEEAVAERLASKLGPPQAGLPVVYTTNKRGPHPPGKTRRWLSDRIKSMPGARKVGRDWEISLANYEAWATAADRARVRSSDPPRRPPLAKVESVDDAELMRRVQQSLQASGYRRSK
jgi:hypothetical protein